MHHRVQMMLALAVGDLERAGVLSARFDAEVLLAHALGVDRRALARVRDITEEQDDAFRRLVQRRAGREPLQHLTGSAGFRYLDVLVGPGVFVPRPETEVLAQAAIDELWRLVESGVQRPVAVDLCTGSGAVAAAMASEVPQATVTAVELSPQAHAFAVRNAQPYGVDVRLGDIADAVGDLAGQVHVVAANPPYIPLSAFESVTPEARNFDPPLALWSGEDGLDVMRVVARVAADLLVDNGLVVCEHADSQGTAAPAVFASSGVWTQVRDNLDLSRRPRFVSARRVPTDQRLLAP